MESTAVALPLEENPEFLKVPPHWVYNNLNHLNKHKVPGPDRLSNWLLKEAGRIPCAASYMEQKLPLCGSLRTFSFKDQASLRP